MEVLGIQFAPVNIPIKRRLQTLAAAAWFFTMIFGGPICLLVTIYLVLYSKWWPVVLVYLIWAWGVDRDISETGGRPIEWVRDWAWWKYMKDYFPLSLERVPWVELDPKRNYLFCCFPHGMLTTGAFSAFGTTVGGFHDFFPHHRVHNLTLAQHFSMPFFRDLALSLGACSVSSKSINWILGKSGGGNTAVLVVGGAAESFNCRPGEYKLVLRNRKGFIKLALKNGAPLVPVFSFGETDVFSQVSNPEGSLLRHVQDGIRKITGFGLAIPIGRGFFQYSFGMVPLRRRITTLVGMPLDIEKIENPSQEDIDELHEKFIVKLTELFEEQKHRYINNADKVSLIIE